jgi:hypothetical protein
MRRIALALALAASVGCGSFFGPSFVGGDTPRALYESAEVAYSAALEGAVTQARVCAAEVPVTEDCDEFIVTVNHAAKRGSEALMVGELIVAGVPQCDEATEPGCNLRKLAAVAATLQALVGELERR